MPASKSFTTTVKVREELREGAVYVLTSPDLPGLFLAGENIGDLRADVPRVIEGLYQFNYGLKVKAYPAVPPVDFAHAKKAPDAQPIGWTLLPCPA